MTEISSSTRRTHILKVRLSEFEMSVLKDRAGNTACAIYMREKAIGSLTANTSQLRPKPARTKQPSTDTALLREIARIGNNLNQIARVVNALAKHDQPLELVAVALHLEKIWKDLHVLQNL